MADRNALPPLNDPASTGRMIAAFAAALGDVPSEAKATLITEYGIALLKAITFTPVRRACASERDAPYVLKSDMQLSPSGTA
jgi:hypothetical protein